MSPSRDLTTPPRVLTYLAGLLWLILGITSLGVAFLWFGVGAVLMLAAAPVFVLIGLLVLLRPHKRWVLSLSLVGGLVVAGMTALVAFVEGGIAGRLLLASAVAAGAAGLSVPAYLASRTTSLQKQRADWRWVPVGAALVLLGSTALMASGSSPIMGAGLVRPRILTASASSLTSLWWRANGR